MVSIEYVHKLLELYNQLCSPLCQQTGISQTSLDILMFLKNNPQYKNAADIVKFRGIKANLVSVHVERLVQEGYLTFEGEALHLTDAGQAEAARTARAMEETEKLALQDFTVEDIAQLHSLLERMHRNLQGKAPSGEQKPLLEY